MFYSVVLLDGKERQNLSFDEVKNLFFKRQINQNSLICSSENPNWQMLKRTFDLSQWVGAPPVPAVQNNFPPPANPFEQPDPANPPVTFNQFPPNAPNEPNNPFGQNTSKGYSQNNQTETYYQAETNQTNYNFQNNQSDIAPSKYNNTGNPYNYSPDHRQNPVNDSGKRNGLRAAAIFLLINAFFYVAYLFFGSALSVSRDESAAYQAGSLAGSFVPLLIDLILALKLWKLDDTESARKWVLARAYLGFAVFGLIFPMISFNAGEFVIGVFSLVSTFFYFISLAIVLHGKENPPPSRVIIGTATFAVYFLIMFGTIAFAFVGKLAPEIAKLDIPKNAQLEQYKIEGREFEDKTTGAKVVLPEGWSMIKLDNPVISTPEARMIAIDKAGNRLTLLEVVPVPGNLDMKRQNSSLILDQLADNVVQAMKEESQKGSGFGGKNSFNEVTRLGIFIGSHPAKLLVFNKTTGGIKSKGHLIITYDELTFYVLHSWCPTAEYDQAQSEFTFFEKNFTVPEKINSTFTQSAENLKK